MARITKVKEVKVTQNTFVATKCDICGKGTPDENDNSFYNLEHHHSAWGNDSIDSFEYFDVCSFNCYMKQLKRSVKELEGYASAEIDGKPIKFVEQMIEDYETKS
jgi:hypothetical protein